LQTFLISVFDTTCTPPVATFPVYAKEAYLYSGLVVEPFEADFSPVWPVRGGK
jgi:hypothetical protein